MNPIVKDQATRKTVAENQLNNFGLAKKHLKITLLICILFLIFVILTPSILTIISLLISLFDLRRRNVNYAFEKAILLTVLGDCNLSQENSKLIHNFW